MHATNNPQAHALVVLVCLCLQRASGLRSGEKLYEELLIGDKVSGTDHSRIMRAEEVSLSWADTQELLNQLDQACANYKCAAIKDLLLQAPTGYHSQESLGDFVWLRKEQAAKKPRLVSL